MILTLVSLVLAVLCFSIRELYYHGKLKWQKDFFGFWGEKSDYRKYKKNWDNDPLGYERYPAPDNWYYRLNKDVKYKEKFPLSATLLVGVTDGVHMMQSFMKIFLALSFVPLTGWIWAGVIWLTWGIFFTIFYRLFSKIKTAHGEH